MRSVEKITLTIQLFLQNYNYGKVVHYIYLTRIIFYEFLDKAIIELNPVALFHLRVLWPFY